MSIVTEYTSSEAGSALRRQRTTSTILSVVISLLVVVLIGLVLFLVLIPGWFVETKTIVAYSAPPEEKEVVDRPEITSQVQRKPSAPSSSMAKVIASISPSTVSIPVPEVNVPDPSIDFGSGNDFGDGWGSGTGSGSGGGGTTFFGQTSRAERIAYVIDYSASMRGPREALMREELTKSLDQIGYGTKYQLIFFAGPAWVGGDEVVLSKKVSAEVKGAGGHTYDWKSDGRAHDWETKGVKQEPTWLSSDDRALKKSKKIVKETKLVWGTTWEPALEMALSMSPPPQVIYFMTDGSAGSNSEKVAKSMGLKAKKLGAKINCIAMMEPKAFKAMDDMAKRSGGHFTKVMAKGEVVKVR